MKSTDLNCSDSSNRRGIYSSSSIRTRINIPSSKGQQGPRPTQCNDKTPPCFGNGRWAGATPSPPGAGIGRRDVGVKGDTREFCNRKHQGPSCKSWRAEYGVERAVLVSEYPTGRLQSGSHKAPTILPHPPSSGKDGSPKEGAARN